MSQPKLAVLPAPVRSTPTGAEPPVEWQARKVTPNRHGAIERQLFTYTHYKSWADKMRVSWAKDEADAAEDPHKPR
ncbi:MAG TPA: hypothetical protein VLA38_07670 [Steroidobacteraceae bacterium]|nr:hypothetical protein [Steroidobacteraceae bacterium]